MTGLWAALSGTLAGIFLVAACLGVGVWLGIRSGRKQ